MNDENGNHITGNGDSDTNRQSESPARTIDSHDSTTGSMDTIVDRATHHSNAAAGGHLSSTAVAMGGISSGLITPATATTNNHSHSHEEMMQTTIEHSTNTTNLNHNSLTNSEVAMLQQQNASGSEDELMLHQQRQQSNKLQQQMSQRPMDTQSHIYSSPVYEEKPQPQQQPQPLKLSAASLVQVMNGPDDDLKKAKLISHEEFKQQLQETIASRATTLDSRISKKQRFPPELIKDDGSSLKSSRSLKKKKSSRKSSTACCSAFPVQIILGLIQLLLAISLVALGSLLIVRDASLSTAGCGIWTGLIAAVTGSLGVVGLRKTQTAFLALSLVCIATSTLALAISGVGLSRDVNRSKEKFDLLNANSEVSAASGLIFTLFLHFVVSIISVYRCALQICSSSKTAELEDIIIKSNAKGLALDAEKVDQYMKAMSMAGSDKDANEKYAAMWMYAAQNANMVTPKPKRPTGNGRQVMLIPATGKIAHPPQMMPQPMLPPPPAAGRPIMGPYRGMTLPYMRPAASMPVIYGPPSLPPPSMVGTYRTQRSSKSIDARKKRRAAGQVLRTGKCEANRRQRRKSDADVIDGNPSFQYTGLDRAIADNFLARQEQSQVGSHVDYSSSSGASDTYGQTRGGMAPSRTSSKTKIVCRDVVM